MPETRVEPYANFRDMPGRWMIRHLIEWLDKDCQFESTQVVELTRAPLTDEDAFVDRGQSFSSVDLAEEPFCPITFYHSDATYGHWWYNHYQATGQKYLAERSAESIPLVGGIPELLGTYMYRYDPRWHEDMPVPLGCDIEWHVRKWLHGTGVFRSLLDVEEFVLAAGAQPGATIRYAQIARVLQHVMQRYRAKEAWQWIAIPSP